MSKTETACKLSRSSDGLHFAGSLLTYRITGLTAYNLDRLRITLKANPPDAAGTFHIDTLDLYNSRARENYAEACAKYMKAEQSGVIAELSQLIEALEAERVSMREKGGAAPVPEMTTEERKEALDILKGKDLLKEIIGGFDAIGFIGEKYNKMLGYLATVSRLQPDPLALLILSRSGAGKTSLQDALCKFVPPESAIQYTRLTGQSLFYRDENALKNKVLTIDESPEQTGSILQTQFTKNTHEWYSMTCDESSIQRLHHNIQRLLKPLTITFSRDLKLVWPYSRLQMRREQKKFISLVKANTLLHQYLRKTGSLQRQDGTKVDFVQATQKDIDLALELGREVFARNVNDVSPTARKLLTEIVALVKEKYDGMRALDPKRELFMYEVPFTRKGLREETDWSETQVRRNIDQLVEQGYVGRISGRQGSTFRYLLLDDGSADPEFCFNMEEQKTAEEPKTKNQPVNGKSSPLRRKRNTIDNPPSFLRNYGRTRK